MLSASALTGFAAARSLSDKYAIDASRYFLPLAERIDAVLEPPAIVGVCGAQGTGKSTLAALFGEALCAAGRRVVVLSLDDFYLPAASRRQLAEREHALFRTRGVPGTHDVDLLERCIDRLLDASADEVDVPVFDKRADDRLESARKVAGAAEFVLLEGWCVGIPPQAEAALAEPVNALERERDPDGRWRRSVNAALGGAYARIFSRLAAIVFLEAPDFDSIRRWRLEQETRLSGAAGSAMSADDVADFVAHFERLTRHGLECMPGSADAVLELDRRHRCRGLRFRHRLDR